MLHLNHKLTEPAPEPLGQAQLKSASAQPADQRPAREDREDISDLPWQPGEIIAERYLLLHLLGRGGYGAVFAATQVVSGQAVALKLLHRHSDPKGLRRFEREAQVLARLRHVHTVRVLDAGYATGGAMYLAMERLSGETLEAHLRRRSGSTGHGDALPQADAIEIAVQVLDSLAEAHANGVVHRDIKPSNIMLVPQDSRQLVKLLDFGVATWTRGDTPGCNLSSTDHVVGTPTYMSPEQCLGQPADARSDLYSLAVVLYRCVCGQLPFDDRAAVNTMYAHVHVPARDLACVAQVPVNSAFADAVMRALAKDPERRFASAEEMRVALLAAAAAPLESAAIGRDADTTGTALKPVVQREGAAATSSGQGQQTPKRSWLAPLLAAIAGAAAAAAAAVWSPWTGNSSPAQPPAPPVQAPPASNALATATERGPSSPIPGPAQGLVPEGAAIAAAAAGLAVPIAASPPVALPAAASTSRAQPARRRRAASTDGARAGQGAAPAAPATAPRVAPAIDPAATLPPD